MNHYYETIHGWFNYESLYKDMVNKFPSGSRFVEVGSWLGRSACYLGVEIVNSGKDIKLDCVDLWYAKDIPELKDEEVVAKGTLYKDFLRNIEPLKDVITPIRMTSAEAVDTYEDNSLDFVFVDADHTKEGISFDVPNWYKKVKVGGVLAGHDYDYPAVGETVREFFDNHEVIKPNIWVHYKQ